jgi:uncharacterized protein (TIGR03437 family)
MLRQATLAITSAALLWGETPPVILTIQVDNYVPYHFDVFDYSKLASLPDKVPGPTNQKTFATFVFIGDIVSVNGSPAKGTWTARATNLYLAPDQQPGRPIADVTRQNIIDMYFDILQPDGTQLGTIMASGLTRGSPPPGAPFIQTGDTLTITGGAGAFLGTRGQAGGIDFGSPRQASDTEDPYYRRVNGGATRSYVIHLLPLARPEVITSPAGPSIFHADFTRVSNSSPAKSGEVLIMMASGMGPTRPGVDPGQAFPSDKLQVANVTPQVLINGAGVDTMNCVGWPGLVDTYRVDFRIPAGVSAGNARVRLSSSFIAGSEVTIPVQ